MICFLKRNRDNLCHALMVIMAILAAWVAVTDVGRPAFSGQPATHEPRPLAGLALTGGYQAQGRGR